VADVDRDAFALNLEDGSQLWRTTLASSASTSPITDDEYVFFVSEEGSVEAFDKTNGDPVWPTTTPLVGRLLADPILVEDELFVPVMDNSDCIIFGVDADTGSTRCVVAQDES
jgi:outer membrane protein assembly factor BamB